MTQSISLNTIRSCLEGVVPSMIATVAPDGTPNITYVSQVHFVDAQHVALSYQFFNKTRENILANPYATVQVIDPDNAAHYRMTLRYLRTETEGPLFENMKAKLAGIASHSGMSKVFRLLGADIYEVLAIEGIHCERLPCALPERNRLSALRASIQQISGCNDLDTLFNAFLATLRQHFEIHHAMLLMYDGRGNRLYTVASHGYAVSGIGAEIPMGTGIIGVAARECTPIRIMYLTGQYTYNLAVRKSLQQNNPELELEMEIPFAGLAEPHSQLAVPITSNRQLIGVIYADSNEDLRFTYEDEDALMTLAGFFALCCTHLQETVEQEPENIASAADNARLSGPPCVIRHFAANDSIFIDEEYLIKGVAGAIFWKLLQDYTQHQRTEFNNRELRLNSTIGLPEIGDNLEARLILLQKRLTERCDFLRIKKTGRGRFQLQVSRALSLLEV
ncbi:MAG: GAF domain-containing protein [Gammaproteobacteria bacterium]|nr:GAF domain-containing protein [Gammaproteobacteria bacterium]